MKELADGIKVPARTYYYLLDFNEQDNYNYISSKFNANKLCSLNIHQFSKLFEYATEQDKLKL